MTFTLWRCKRLTKRIWKLEGKIKFFQQSILTLRKWIGKDKTKLNNLLKYLSDEENLEYGLSVGLIDNADYQIMRRGKNDRK